MITDFDESKITMAPFITSLFNNILHDEKEQTNVISYLVDDK